MMIIDLFRGVEISQIARDAECDDTELLVRNYSLHHVAEGAAFWKDLGWCLQDVTDDSVASPTMH
jgi:hypothetical protein